MSCNVTTIDVENEHAENPCMAHSVRTRLWREIADELVREANTGRMAILMKELNRVSEDLEEAKIVFGRHRESLDRQFPFDR